MSDIANGCDFTPQATLSIETHPDEELSEMLDFLSFEGDTDLLRGVQLSTIMRGAGRIFQSSQGSGDTYCLSQPVERLGYFISHNWDIRRSVKYIALSFKFRSNNALLGAILCLLVCTTTSLLGWQPGCDSVDSDFPVSITCRLFVVPCTLIALFAGGTFCWGKQSPYVFLDKVCINQHSPEVQQLGIQKLGAFLRSSHRMVALYSNVYLTKLWTIYEVAGFLMMHDLEDLELLPVMLPCYFLALLFMTAGYNVFHVLWRVVGLPDALAHIVTMIGISSYICLLRHWGKHKARMLKHLTSFEVRKATCALERDRPMVYNNIASLLKASGNVPRTASVEDALDAFDCRIRETMSLQFHTLFGKFSFSYKEHLLLCLTSFAAGFLDYIGGSIGHGAPWEEVLLRHIFDPFWFFCGLPLWQLSVEAMTSLCLEWNGLREVVLLLGLTLTNGFAGSCLLSLTEFLAKRAAKDDVLFYGCSAAVVATSAASICILPRVLSRKRHARTTSMKSVPKKTFERSCSFKATLSAGSFSRMSSGSFRSIRSKNGRTGSSSENASRQSTPRVSCQSDLKSVQSVLTETTMEDAVEALVEGQGRAAPIDHANEEADDSSIASSCFDKSPRSL